MKRRPQHKVSGGKSQQAGTVRIIAGRWRGRRLPVADVAGLRPSGDRVRETLFNWLAPYLPGSRCLDLFAGTGALGFEALSRGAGSAVLVERDRRARAALMGAVALLGAESQIEIVGGDALKWLATGKERFDVIFLDPPFEAEIWRTALELLTPRLRPAGLIYAELPAGLKLPAPPGVSLLRQKRIAGINLHLFALSQGEQID